MSKKEATISMVRDARALSKAALHWKIMHYRYGAAMYADFAKDEFARAKELLRRARALRDWKPL